MLERRKNDRERPAALPRARVVQLTLTNRCMCSCAHCGVALLRDAVKDELSLQEIEAVFADLARCGVNSIDLFGGEPTLRKDLPDIVQLGKARGFVMSLETNGYLLDHRYLQALQTAGLDLIYLSLDDPRPEAHDQRRGLQGIFARAVRALRTASELGLEVHVSTVPMDRCFFVDGRMNRLLELAFAAGASRLRLLLPRHVGRSALGSPTVRIGGEGARDIFSFVDEAYRDRVYVHSPDTPFGAINRCSAKAIFCHIMSNGWVAPCPYFPLVMGDILRESLIDVFARIQDHPLVRKSGQYCPMRSQKYLDEVWPLSDPAQPYLQVESANSVDLNAPCSHGCDGCGYLKAKSPRAIAEVVADIERIVAEDYGSLELYGGEPLGKPDLGAILERVPERLRLILWTPLSPYLDRAALAELCRRPVDAVKLYIPPVDPLLRTNTPLTEQNIAERLRPLADLTGSGLPVYAYLPASTAKETDGRGASDELFEALVRLGVERIYRTAMAKNEERQLPSARACFGRRVRESRLLYLRDPGPAGDPEP